MNWRIAVIPATIIPIIIIAVQFDIKFEDVLAIGVIPFVLAVLAFMVKLGLQGIKLAYIARSFLGPFDSIIPILSPGNIGSRAEIFLFHSTSMGTQALSATKGITAFSAEALAI